MHRISASGVHANWEALVFVKRYLQLEHGVFLFDLLSLNFLTYPLVLILFTELNVMT